MQAGRYANQVVDHAVEYVNGRIHTNGLEKLLELAQAEHARCLRFGEPFHLFRYLDEQTFRYNHMDGRTRFERMIGNVGGRRLTYSEPTGVGAATSH